MNLKITGKDTYGNVYPLPYPFWLVYDSDIDAPADSLELTFLNETIPQIVTITVEGDISFNGIVDLISNTKSRLGEKTVLYARSLAAMLIDSEALPGKVNIKSLESVENSFSLGGRFKGFIYDTYTPIESLTLPKGSSLWYYLRLFCEQTMGHTPRITNDGYIKATAFSDEILHDFNKQSTISVKTDTDYSDVVAATSVRGENGVYSLLMLNQKVSIPYPRHRYVIPGGAWVNNRELAGEKVLNQSVRRHKTVTLELAHFYPAKIADCAVFEEKEYRIISIKHTVGESGITTKITLAEKKYI